MPTTPRHLRTVDPDDFDPYKLDDPSHDPARFYAFCGKESASMTVRVPTDYINIIGALVASREIPEYQTPADFIRDAIHHRIYWYQHNYARPDIGDQINVFTQLERSRERERAFQARKDIIVQFRREFQNALVGRSAGGCQAVIAEVKMAMDTRDASDDTYKTDLQDLLGYMEREARSI